MLFSSTIVAGILAVKAAAVTLTVSTSGGNASSPLLYGIMFEVSSRGKQGNIRAASPNLMIGYQPFR